MGTMSVLPWLDPQYLAQNLVWGGVLSPDLLSRYESEYQLSYVRGGTYLLNE